MKVFHRNDSVTVTHEISTPSCGHVCGQQKNPKKTGHRTSKIMHVDFHEETREKTEVIWAHQIMTSQTGIALSPFFAKF